MALEKAGVQLVAEGAGGFSADMGKASGSISAFGEIATGALRHIGTLAVDAFMSAGKAAISFAGDGISAARQTEKLMASTEQTIKTMGNAAERSAQQIADMATNLSDASGKSLFGDDQIQQSENLLLTFGNIKGETFDLATALTVDLAAALGGAPKDQAMMLGKALQDPIKGMTALGKAGLTFSEEQKAAVKAMVESGDAAGAQALIIEELTKQVGGQAEAQAKAAGGMVQFKARLGEVGESIGKALLPMLNQMADFLNTTIAPAIETAATAFSAWLADPATQAGIQRIVENIRVGIGTAMTFLTDTAIPALVTGWGMLTTAMDLLRAALVTLSQYWVDAGDATNSFIERIGFVLDTITGFTAEAIGPLEALGITINSVFAGMAVTFSDAKTPVEGFLNVLSNISPTFELLRGIVEAALPPIQSIVESVFGIISSLIQDHGEEMLSSVEGVWNQIQILIQSVLPPIQDIVESVFGAIATFLENHGAEIEEFLSSSWQQIASIIQMAVAVITGIVVPAFQTIAAFLQAHAADIQNILSGAWQAISGIISGVLTLISGLLRATLQAMQGDWSGAWSTIQSTSASFVSSIGSAIMGFLNMIAGFFGTTLRGIADTWASNWNNMVSLVTTAIGNIVSLIMGLPAMVAGVGEAVVASIRAGFESAWNNFLSWWNEQLQAFRDSLPFSEPKDPASPLRGLAKSGRAIVDMMQTGMDSAGPLNINGLVSSSASPSALMRGGNTTTNSSTYSPTINYAPTYGRAPRAPAMDIAAMTAWGI